MLLKMIYNSELCKNRNGVKMSFCQRNHFPNILTNFVFEIFEHACVCVILGSEYVLPHSSPLSHALNAL